MVYSDHTGGSQAREKRWCAVVIPVSYVYSDRSRRADDGYIGHSLGE